MPGQVDTDAEAGRASEPEEVFHDNRSTDHDNHNGISNTNTSLSQRTHGNSRTLQRKLSISEQASVNSSGRLQPPPALTWFERPFRVSNPTTNSVLTEATGWSMDSAARGPLNQAGSFVGSAIVRLATIEAECKSPRLCDNTVYGIRPSSLLTVASVIVGLSSAFLMPIVGAVVDHTRHRKTMGSISALVVVAVTGAQIMISEDTWFTVLILEMIGGFFLLVHATAVLAYLPDLSHIQDDLAHYTSRFNMCQMISQAIYVAFVVALSKGIDADATKTAQISLATAFAVTFLLFSYAWTFLFRKRPALSEVPEDSNLLTTGFKQVGRTAYNIGTRYHSLRWFMISLMWSPEAGAGVVISITVTYMTVVLDLTGIQIGVVNLVMLLSSVPGSQLAKYVCVRFNPLRSFQAALLFFAVSVALTVVVADGPDRKNWTYFFAFLWGISFGWLYPSQRVLYCTLTPKGQETEIMGVFTFCGQIVGWLPPLLFSVMNENNVDMRWGLSLISFFVLFSLFFTFFIGNYDDAVAEVAPTDENGVKDEIGWDTEREKVGSKDEESLEVTDVEGICTGGNCTLSDRSEGE